MEAPDAVFLPEMSALNLDIRKCSGKPGLRDPVQTTHPNPRVQPSEEQCSGGQP